MYNQKINYNFYDILYMSDDEISDISIENKNSKNYRLKNKSKCDVSFKKKFSKKNIRNDIYKKFILNNSK